MSVPEILINQLFAGKYLSEGKNIGHEVIYLFNDDDGVRYLFITPNGSVNYHDVQNVIFVRNIKKRKTVEVVAIGTNLSPADNGIVAKARYGGVSLDRIFHGNTYHGGKDSNTTYATYEAGQLLIPGGNNRIFLTIDEDFDSTLWPNSIYLKTDKKVLIPQGMRSYFSPQSDPEAYTQLSYLISSKDLWKKANKENGFVADESLSGHSPTFLEIIGKADDELIFSNLLSYYFNYNHKAFLEFALSEKLLNIPDLSTEFTITRESNYNIDLWIEDSKHIIVIENKINSGINGQREVGSSQLDKYYLKAREYAVSSGKEVYFYAFIPDHNSIDIKHYDPHELYKIIPYSYIYEFFASHAGLYIADRYFPEFLRGLERQSMSLSELNLRTMRSRFMREISQAQ